MALATLAFAVEPSPAVAGATIEARVAGAAVGWASSREDGDFVVEALPPGKPVDLVVRHDGYEEARRTGVESGEKTITVHRGRVMEKMKADSLAELVKLAAAVGIPGKGKSPEDE